MNHDHESHHPSSWNRGHSTRGARCHRPSITAVACKGPRWARAGCWPLPVVPDRRNTMTSCTTTHPSLCRYVIYTEHLRVPPAARPVAQAGAGAARRVSSGVRRLRHAVTRSLCHFPGGGPATGWWERGGGWWGWSAGEGGRRLTTRAGQLSLPVCGGRGGLASYPRRGAQLPLHSQYGAPHEEPGPVLSWRASAAHGHPPAMAWWQAPRFELRHQDYVTPRSGVLRCLRHHCPLLTVV